MMPSIGSAGEVVGGAGEDAGTITGSLVHLLDRTKTRAGSRLLREWVVHPLIDSSSICERQDAVQTLMDNQDLLNTIREVRRNVIYKKIFMHVQFWSRKPAKGGIILNDLKINICLP
jgi:DNA mismatch repair ATPase MutS